MSEETKFTLPLPPSKNRRIGIRNGRIYTSHLIKNYYEDVFKIMRYQLHLNRIFTHNSKIVIWCNWFVGRKGTDAVNFHDALADAIKQAIEVDDQYFLLRDFNITVDKKNPRVEILMSYLE